MSESQSLFAYAIQQLQSNAASRLVPCKVCDADAKMFGVLDFEKTCNPGRPTQAAASVPVYYWRCERCAFVFTRFFDGLSAQQWSRWIYNPDYYDIVDTDYSSVRPAANARYVDSLLRGNRAGYVGLDYGGGNGKTAEALRCLGYVYDTYDPYGLTSTKPECLYRYNFCTSFEVAEHTPDPKGFIDDIVRLTSPDRLLVLVTTLIHDGHLDDPTGMGWWYAAPRNGHISLYSARSLQVLAARVGLDFWSESPGLHLFSRGYSRAALWRLVTRAKIAQRLKTALGR